MGYVAVKGGGLAIENALKYVQYERLKGGSSPLGIKQIADQLYLAVDRVMSEGSLYAPELAALAIKQASGDMFEASFMVRAYRATRPRLGYSLARPTDNIRILRRISAAFKDIPGGQILGPTMDYSLRLLDFSLKHETAQGHREWLQKFVEDAGLNPPEDGRLDSLPRVIDLLRKEDLVEGPVAPSEKQISDITRGSLEFPAPRSAAMQALARGDSGGMLLLAYSNMRGFGSVHPVIGELRVGYLPIEVVHPVTSEPYCVGEVKVTEVEMISKAFGKGNDEPKFSVGYGICFGQNETKAISMAVLDKSIQALEPQAPSESQEFVLQHIDGIESMGFCNHWKLPHYVTFQSSLDRLRKVQNIADDKTHGVKEEHA
jgi:alpha-D-ribose 1-methylphosphonate 5-triphosphate synthase subunit PhnI